MSRFDYKWRVLGFLFVAFFLELGSRQLYGAAFASLGAFYLAGAAVLLPALIWFFEKDRERD